MTIKLILLFAISLFCLAYGQIDCQLYRDRLFFGLDYPDSAPPEVHSCADRRLLKYQLNRVLNIKVNRTITKTNRPAYENTVILLSPKDTMHLYPKEWRQYKDMEKMTRTMHLIRSTNIEDLIWKREGSFQKFSEIIYEFDEDINCPNDIDANEFRLLDGWHMYNKEFFSGPSGNLKLIIIPVFKNIPSCLRLGVINYLKTDNLTTLNDKYKNEFKFPNGTAYNPYLSSSTLYHTSIEAIYPEYHKINDMETSTAPWLDEDLKRRNSTWCRSYRHILAFSGLVFEFEDDGESIEIEATDPCYCSVEVYGNHFRAVYMRFPSWDIVLSAWILKKEQIYFHLSSLQVKRISDGKGFPIDFVEKLHARKQTFYVQNQRYNQWNKRANGGKSCGAFHLRFWMFAAEFDDFGVGYNFSRSFADMKKIHTITIKSNK